MFCSQLCIGASAEVVVICSVFGCCSFFDLSVVSLPTFRIVNYASEQKKRRKV